MVKFSRLLFIIVLGFICTNPLSAQVVENVKFGKNRVQYKKFKWQYYQSRNFNTFFNQNGQDLAKLVMQVAEEELPQIEEFTEYSLQRRANIVVYNEYADMQQSNIGIDIDWQNTSGTTKLVNNKMVVYFNGDHAHLRRQIRQGIARIITDNVLFGEDLGEFAGNQALLDLPTWLTDGYVDFAAENWNTQLDDDLKSEMLSGNYTKFYSFAFKNPRLAGHAFWYYIEEKYKKENVTYFLYLARLYKNLNRASMQVCKMKFKDLLAQFMEYQEDKYENDIRKRKPYPKGQQIESFDVDQRHDYYRINVNPVKKSNAYVLVEFKKGFVKVKLYNDFEETVLLKYGIRSYRNEVNPDYPLLAWDPKGTRITVIYNQEGRLKLFVYDLFTTVKYPKLDLTDQFQQIQDVKYMLDSRTLLLSATKNGRSDIFTLNLENEKVTQITNDVYADLDPTYVALPGKNGIMFASNRPSGDARGGDSSIPSHYRYNIFFVNNANAKPELNQITQLTSLKYGNARSPMPYNINHFTFVSDENGVANRYAGFFTTKAEGLDTLVLIGDDILRNPSLKEVDSALRANKKTDVDSVAVVAVSSDSTYTFPLSNYESNLAETRVAGDNQQVSEVTRQSDAKTLYKLKINEDALRRRNITVPPTTYMKRVIMNDKIAADAAGKYDQPLPGDSTKKNDDLFQNNFEDERKDSSGSMEGTVVTVSEQKYDPLKSAKLYPYKPVKFGADYGGIAFGNAILFSRYQPYSGGSGPIMLGSGTPLNGLIRLGTSELMEDHRIFGGFRLSTNLKDNEWLFGYENYKRRFDWGLTYYRNAQEAVVYDPIPEISGDEFTGKIFTNIYMGNVSYPFDRTKRISFSFGLRNDNFVLHTNINDDATLKIPNSQERFALTHAEYVYDNTLNPTQNIWNGLRYKFFFDWNTNISKEDSNVTTPKKYNFNWGFDARYYYPIHRNFIWAGRVSGDFSWGNQKTVYYLGGADGWLMFGGNRKQDGTYRFFNPDNVPAPDYAFQTLVGNLRGFIQNVANGNNAVTINSEFRLPVWTTFFNRPINNAFVRNFQLVQFIDLGTAWNGGYKGIARPSSIYGQPPVQVYKKVGGIGPFAGGYGFGARSVLLGYFIKVDWAWEMNGFFKGKPLWYLSLGLDF
ncbi:MAG: hypothetical protein V4685_00255 [Bacteroidota bacterium]